MSEAAQQDKGSSTQHRAVVARLLDSDSVVLNVGTDDGVKVGQRYLIYTLSEDEITDPITKKSLGKVEIPKGTGKVTNVQKHLAVLESDKEQSRQGASLAHMWEPSLFPTAKNAPFRSPHIGDLVKRVY